jgi:hypothetical protein
VIFIERLAPRASMNLIVSPTLSFVSHSGSTGRTASADF